MRILAAVTSALVFSILGCAEPAPQGLFAAEEGPGPHVVFDVHRTPLPEIPLPNNFATRVDGNSPTLLRVNASIQVAPTEWERETRAALDELSGWGTLAPITVAFSEPLDLDDLVSRHQEPAEVGDDALYVVDVTEGSPDFCNPQLYDLGQGHFPTIQDRPEYYPDEPHASFEQLLYEQENEDLNGNGTLDPGEDTDMDGVLDRPNVLHEGDGRFDVISFYERETNTLIAKPLYPLREKTRYAVVLTKRLRGVDGNPVRSPFGAINHAEQTRALEPLLGCLPGLGLAIEDVAFTWLFTTQSTTEHYVAIREGIYGRGALANLATEFPPGPAILENVRVQESKTTNTKIVPGAQFLQFGSQLFTMYAGSEMSGTREVLEDSLKFVDFYASGALSTPQFFPREDADGAPLPIYKQRWKVNPATGEAFVRPENVPFLMAVPRDRNGPAPVVIFEHGHTSSKLDMLLLAGPFSRFGLATISIDSAGHGLGLGATEQLAVTEMVKPYGLEPMAKALLKGRTVDFTGDGIGDSGADFFTSHVIHSRDMIRQTAVDLMQLVRTLRSFDGVRRWEFDVNRDGEPDLAGDFDGDGKVDVGGSAPIYVSGASLGGILASLVGGIEPEIDAIVPILPGGQLSEIGVRASLGQVRDAMVLRLLGPLLLAHPDKDGVPTLYQMVPQGVRGTEVEVAKLPAALTPGKIAVVRNLKTQEWRCARVQPNGHLRVAVSSDLGDPLRFEVYDNELPSRPREGCETEGETPAWTLESFGKDVSFAGRSYAAGSPLAAILEGSGFRRGSPELRRMVGLGQVGLETADPGNFAPFYEQTRTFAYPDGSTVATRSLMVLMTGDSGVPVAAGAALLRAAGHLNYRTEDPRYGKSQQKVLIDTGYVEGVERTGRHINSVGKAVLMDVDSLKDLTSADDGFNIPRLTPPIRLVRKSDKLGGTVGALFPIMSEIGDHSFPVPDPSKPFDLGTLLINIFADYLSTGGERVALEPCMERSNCDWIKPIP